MSLQAERLFLLNDIVLHFVDGAKTFAAIVFASCPFWANAGSDVSYIPPPTLQFDYATA